MPILKPFVDKAFREGIKKGVYENEHLLYDIVQAKTIVQTRSYFNLRTDYSVLKLLTGFAKAAFTD